MRNRLVPEVSKACKWQDALSVRRIIKEGGVDSVPGAWSELKWSPESWVLTEVFITSASQFEMELIRDLIIAAGLVEPAEQIESRSRSSLSITHWQISLIWYLGLQSHSRHSPLTRWRLREFGWLLQVIQISQLVRIKSRESYNGSFSFSAVWCIFIALKCVSRDQILGQGRLKYLYVGRRGRSRG